MRLVLEIYVNDIDKFIDLVPDEWLTKAEKTPSPIEECMRRFSTENFQIMADDNTHLMVDLQLVEPRLRIERPNPFAGAINPYTKQPVPGPPEDKRVLYAKLIYSFASRTKTLSIIPPLGRGGPLSASFGFIAYNKGVPVVELPVFIGNGSHASGLARPVVQRLR